jgi:hypothetical protein
MDGSSEQCERGNGRIWCNHRPDSNGNDFFFRDSHLHSQAIGGRLHRLTNHSDYYGGSLTKPSCSTRLADDLQRDFDQYCIKHHERCSDGRLLLDSCDEQRKRSGGTGHGGSADCGTDRADIDGNDIISGHSYLYDHTGERCRLPGYSSYGNCNG